MGFVILVSGVGVLGTAIAYAVRPTERKLELLRPLSLAAIFAAVCSFAVGAATALKFAADRELGPAAARASSGAVRGVRPALRRLRVPGSGLAARHAGDAPAGVIPGTRRDQ